MKENNDAGQSLERSWGLWMERRVEEDRGYFSP